MQYENKQRDSLARNREIKDWKAFTTPENNLKKTGKIPVIDSAVKIGLEVIKEGELILS